MNDAFEIHDSTLAGVAAVGRDLVFHLAPAYVHRSEGRPGVDRGSGWLQDVDLKIAEAVAESLPSTLPNVLSDGSFSIDEARWDNIIPMPLAVSGAVTLSAVTNRGECLVVRGKGASVVLLGAPRYVEEFPGDPLPG